MRRALFASLIVAIIAVSLVAWLGLRADHALEGPVPRLAVAISDPVARGEYLVRAGNCRSCHTARGGADYAGGRAIPTPFGTFYTPNLTPDAATGLGEWSADEFWRALHEGRGRNGRLLYPSFPYTNYTKVSRADSDAMYAFLRSVPAAAAPNREHALRFPYDQRFMLVGWRALFFRPGVYQLDPERDEAWNRGAYLTQGLGHCSACHEARNALGAIQSRDNPAGGLQLNWYAPTLESRVEAGVTHWEQDQVTALLRDGIARNASTQGPMAEVVYESLQHLATDDLDAMAHYLRALPDREPARLRVARRQSKQERSASLSRGERLYGEHCADCHGDAGQGRPPAAPALAGNRTVTMGNPVNPIRVTLYGGYAPATAGNPQPFGMPPYTASLDDQDIADVLSFVRASWGNQGTPVQDFEVRRQRNGPLW